MFTSSLSSNTETNIVHKHHGLDLSTISCHKLESSAIYSKYSKDQLHYVIDAVQKGRNAPTHVGLKRLIKKNKARAAKQKLNPPGIPELNPKAPEEICTKALRTEFRNQLQKNHMQEQVQKKTKNDKFIKRKQHQRARRNQSVRLVRKYIKELLPHFGDRLQGYGRCPKVSRKQIKDYLMTLGIQARLDPVCIKTPEEIEKINRQRGGRRMNRNQRMPRGIPNQYPPIGMQPPNIMSQQIPRPPQFCPMSAQTLENLRKGIVPVGFPSFGGIPPGIPFMGANMPIGMNVPMLGGNIPLGVPNVHAQPVFQHTPLVLKDEDFPTLP